jgi:hypothetical protein
LNKRCRSTKPGADRALSLALDHAHPHAIGCGVFGHFGALRVALRGRAPLVRAWQVEPEEQAFNYHVVIRIHLSVDHAALSLCLRHDAVDG